VTSYELPFGRGYHFGRSMRPLLNGIVGGWNLNAQWTAHSGYPFAFPNAAPLQAGTANLHDEARDVLARTAGHTQFDPAYDVYFNTAQFPTQAQAPFTLRDFPTIFPDVRSYCLRRQRVTGYSGTSVPPHVNGAHSPWTAWWRPSNSARSCFVLLFDAVT
jgi:hypothetical protein